MATPILFSCQFASGHGGVAHSMLDIVRHIDRRGFRPIVLCAPEGEVPEFAAAMGAKVYTVGRSKFWCYSPSYPWGTLRDIFTVTRAIIRLAKTEDVRIVHTFDGMVFFAASLAHLFVPELKVIWLDAGFNLYKFYFRVVMRWCFQRAAGVVTGTRLRQAQQLADGLDPTRSAVLPYGTDFHLRSAEALSALPRRDKLRVGIVGRIVPIKNFELFLQAARLVADRHADAEFVIMGTKGHFAEEQAYYQSIVALAERLGLRERVVFHTTPVLDLAPVLNTLDIVVCSSHLETFGRVMVEAMALAKPVVATAVGGLVEVVTDGEAGFLVPPNDAPALAARIAQLLADEELRATMGRNGHARVLRHFDIQMITRKWEQMYESLLREEPLPQGLFATEAS